MEGFVLPEFESTSILKDKDLISVKRKETRLVGINKAIEEAKIYIEDKIVEKQQLPSCLQLLTNAKSNEQSGGYQSETDKDENEAEKHTSPVQNSRNGDIASKKRKASSKLENSKKKRKREPVIKTAPKKNLRNCEHITKPQKKRKHENRSNQNAISRPGIIENGTKYLESNSESELDQNKKDPVLASGVSDRAKKVSRSTLRKRRQAVIKRLLRDKATMNEQCDNQQPVKDITNTIKQSVEDSDEDGDLVPVEIRPGRIRFTPLGKVKDVQEANALDVHLNQNGASEKEAYRWNGFTNKRKGQKWGREKQPPSSWKDAGDVNGHSSSTWDAKNQPSSSWQVPSEVNGQSCRKWGNKIYPPKPKPVDFDKLLPLIDLPKAGDIIAYRLLELSSSCPVLTSFRVGKISSFEPESNKTILVPVPEYPLNLEKKAYDNEGADKQAIGDSVYDEDGTLETDFMSLNDVRIMKLAVVTPLEGPKIQNANGSWTPSTSKKDDEAPDSSNKANGEKDVWEEIAEAVSAKKAQQMQEDRWNKKVTPAHQWSHRNLRGSAIRPTRFRH